MAGVTRRAQAGNDRFHRPSRYSPHPLLTKSGIGKGSGLQHDNELTSKGDRLQMTSSPTDDAVPIATERDGLRHDACNFVVGLGGSTGALEALKHILSRLPPDAGIAYVVVEHVDAGWPGALVDSLASHCRLPVQLASDRTRVERDRVYVGPVASLLTLREGELCVTPRTQGDERGEIDVFLRSLAEDRRERAVGIVLSGPGCDGVSGLRAVRDHDGLTIAQSPETALYDTMPEAAIAAGVVDLILPVEEVPSALMQHTAVTREGRGREAELSTVETTARLPAITDTLLRATGHDFSRYKEGTLVRRVRHRMGMLQLTRVEDYLRLLQQDSGEAERLFKDLLIGVSHFFRDEEAFEALAELVIPRILDASGDDVPVRIWVPGCASGEEAYSLAILVHEQLLGRGSARPVQIFATDIDNEALASARRGRYPADIQQRVPPQRLERYFARDAHGYEVRSSLREMTIFSVHNVVRDPPFSSLDLVSCRNLLIYLKAGLQRRLAPMFHFALRPGGFLFLGPSEGIAGHPDLFQTVDKRHRIFRRNDAVRTPPLDLPHAKHHASWHRAAGPADQKPAAVPLSVRTFERMVLEEFTPPTIAVDDRGEISFVAGRTSRYLQPPPGGLSHNLFDLLRGSLRHEVRGAVEQAARTAKRAVREAVRVDLDTDSCLVRITVRPLPALAPNGPMFAVVLEDVPPFEHAATSSATVPMVDHVEAELRATRAELQAAIEDLEAANEELRSSNEELVSTNEELQSANEELETSREELQSANEELETLNANLQDKAAALSEANDYLQNLLAATQIATVFLDAELRITKYTPAARGVFHLIDTDVGRALQDLAPKVELADLLADCRRVLQSGETIQRQVRTIGGGHWYSASFLPFRRSDAGQIDGVVVTFVDITSLKTTEDALRAREAESSQRASEFDAIFDAMSFPVIVFDAAGKPVRVNRQTREVFGVDGSETDAAGHRQLHAHVPMRALDGRRLEAHEHASARALRGEAVEDLRLVVTDPLRGDRIVETTAIPLRSNGVVVGAVLGWRDVTDKVQAESALLEQQRLLQDIIDGSPSHIFIKDTQGRYVTINSALERAIGLTREQVRGKTDDELPTRDHADSFRVQDRAVLETGEPSQQEQRVVLPGGAERTHLVTKFPLRDSKGQLYGLCGFAADITERKRAEEQRLVLERQVLHAQKLESLGVLAGGVAHDFNNLLQAILGNLDLVSDKVPLGSPTWEGIQRSMQATRRAADLARQMLAFAGKGAYVISHLDLRSVVRDNAELFRATLPKTIELRLHLPEQRACVLADAGQMQQVVLNLITNAAEAVGEEGGTVDLTTGVREFDGAELRHNRTGESVAPGTYAFIEISDTGCGMSAATLDRLFDPFFSTKGAGRGLGLAALMGIARTCHGAVLVDTEPGRGTRMRVAFPACEQEHGDTVAESEHDDDRSEPRRGAVLVVDDEESIRQVCCRIVEHLGHETLSAKDGLDAVDVFRAHHARLACVILDVSMPRLGGVAAMKMMKSIDATVPILLSSGYAEEQFADVAREGDPAGYVSKPYGIQTLSRALDSVLSGRGKA